jgi:hypothetical protein
MTIDEIAERLAVSRTSVWGWVRDLPFDANTPKRSAAQLRAARANSANAKARRDAAYLAGSQEYAGLLGEPTFRDFVCLYIAEGYKRSRNVVALGNSDPAVVSLADRWIRRFSARKLQYAVQYHADQDHHELRSWWGDVLSLPPGAICLQRKSNSNQLRKRTWRSEHGVLTVRTGDTAFRARLQAWIDLTRTDWL